MEPEQSSQTGSLPIDRHGCVPLRHPLPFAVQRNFAAGKSGTIALLRHIFRGLLFTGRRSQRSFRRSAKKRSWKRIFLTLVSSGLAVLALIILVWTIEFDFVGRFAAIKMLGGLGLLVCLFLALQESLSQGNPWRTMVLSSGERKEQIRDYLGLEDAKVAWVDLESDAMDKESLLLGCDSEAVELLLIEEEQESEVPVMPLLASGVRVMGIAAFVETFCQRIPPAEVDAAWLTKLNLRQRDPIVRRIKRLNDLLFASLGLVLSLPILLLASLATLLDSGFPIFFHQTRTGYLGRPYTLFKLRTMRQDAEEGAAQWAQKQDNRVTFVGRFLRKTRIDEIPQLWNVIKGEMSLVGPRPERPELDEEIERTSLLEMPLPAQAWDYWLGPDQIPIRIGPGKFGGKIILRLVLCQKCFLLPRLGNYFVNLTINHEG